MLRARWFVVALFTTGFVAALAAPGWSAERRTTASSNPGVLYRVGGVVYWGADDGTHGAEPWRSDGSPGGTRLLLNVAPGDSSAILTSFAGPGATAFFGANDFDGAHLFKTNGTGPGTHI